MRNKTTYTQTSHSHIKTGTTINPQNANTDNTYIITSKIKTYFSNFIGNTDALYRENAIRLHTPHYSSFIKLMRNTDAYTNINSYPHTPMNQVASGDLDDMNELNNK